MCVPVARMNNEFSNLIRAGDLFFKGCQFYVVEFTGSVQRTVVSIDKMRSTHLIELKIG